MSLVSYMYICWWFVGLACYGIVSPPTSGVWYCRKCESQERAARVVCVCPRMCVCIYVRMYLCACVRIVCECVYVYVCMYVGMYTCARMLQYIYSTMSEEFETRIRKCQLFIVIVIDYIIIGFPIKNV